MAKYPKEWTSQNFLNQIIEMGMLGYDSKKIINVLDIVESDLFIKEFNSAKSPICISYKAGQDKADYELDKKLLDLAKSGDINAMEKLQRKRNPINTLTPRQQEFKGKQIVDMKPKETTVKANVSNLVEGYAMTTNSGIKLKPTPTKPRPPRNTVKTPVKPKEDGDHQTTVAAKGTSRKKVNSGQKVQD